MQNAQTLGPVCTALMNPETRATDAKPIAQALLSPLARTVAESFITEAEALRMTQKQALTAARMCDFIVTGVVSTQKDARTGAVKARSYFRNAALLGSALVLIPEGVRVPFADIQHAAGLQGDQFTRPVPNVSRARMLKVWGHRAAPGTVLTQLSQMRGMWDTLGVTEADKHGFTVVNKSRPLLIAYAEKLQALTDGQLELIADSE